MNTAHESYKTPGQLIAILLETKGWPKRVLAIVLAMDEASVSRIMADKKPITPQVALALEDIFECPAERFLEAQARYDLAVARISVTPDPRRAHRAKLFGEFPVGDMVKRHWIDADNIKDVPAIEAGLARFFEVCSAEEVTAIPHAAKKTGSYLGSTGAQMAWLYRVRQMAREMVVGNFNEASGRRAIQGLNALLLSADELRKVPRILAESGIRFLLVEALPSSKIDGACLWLDDRSPVIALTLRFDRIDNFWFVLRHELEHVIRGDGKSSPMLDADLEGANAGVGEQLPEAERAANEAAANFCVPADKMKRFVARKAPFFAERDLLGFAATLGVHPGLVAGQLQRQTGRYDLFRKHLVKVRSTVAPSAIVDGWGDVAPVGLQERHDG